MFLVTPIFFLTSCSDEVDPDKVDITVQESALKIKNNSKDDLYVFIVDRNELALIDWIALVDGDPHLDAKSSATFDFEDDILGYSDETEEVVAHFWKSVRRDGEEVAGEVEFIVVAL